MTTILADHASAKTMAVLSQLTVSRAEQKLDSRTSAHNQDQVSNGNPILTRAGNLRTTNWTVMPESPDS